MASLVVGFIEFVNALDEGLRHDETMGWAYGITWAIDSDAAAVARTQPPPRPTGILYNPDGSGGDDPAVRRERFDEGAQRGIDVIPLSSISEEQTELAGRLTLALSIAVHRLGKNQRHKEFVTELFRSPYREGYDHLGRKTWKLDWPTIKVEQSG